MTGGIPKRGDELQPTRTWQDSAAPPPPPPPPRRAPVRWPHTAWPEKNPIIGCYIHRYRAEPLGVESDSISS